MRIGTCFLAVVLLTHARVAVARPCGAISADDALDKSVLIVKGELVANHLTVDPPGSDEVSTIRVVRVLKGQTSQETLDITYFLCGQEYEYALRSGRPFIAFIDDSGHLWNNTAILPASTTSPVRSDNPRETLRAEFRAALDDPDPRTARSALGAIAQLDGRASLDLLRQYSDTAHAATRFRALCWRMRFGDVDAALEIGNIVSYPWIVDGEDQDLSSALTALWTLASRGSDPREYSDRFIAAVAAIGQAGDVSIRRDVIRALSGLGARMPFPVLVDGLSDRDSYTRFLAMRTMCRAMNSRDSQCPGSDAFEKNEQSYIAVVRAWAQSR
jgi:hypothetical protein